MFCGRSKSISVPGRFFSTLIVGSQTLSDLKWPTCIYLYMKRCFSGGNGPRICQHFIFNRRADPKIDGHLEIVATSILQQSKVAPGKRCDPKKERIIIYPIGSMYGIFTYIYHKNQPNVGKYTIHGSLGYKLAVNVSSPSFSISNIVWLPPGMKPPATLGRPLPPNTMNLEVQTTTDEFRFVFRRPFVNARVCRFEVLKSFLEMEWRSGWWFQTFFIFNPSWGNNPIWLIFFKWFETTLYHFDLRTLPVNRANAPWREVFTYHCVNLGWVHEQANSDRPPPNAYLRYVCRAVRNHPVVG